MAKYSKGAGKKVKAAMHERKEGTLKSGRSGKKVTSRKQAIAIGLSEARERGEKVPKKSGTKSTSKGRGSTKKSSSKKSSSKSTSKKSSTKKAASKSTTKKSATKKTASKKGASKTSASKKGTSKRSASKKSSSKKGSK